MKKKVGIIKRALFIGLVFLLNINALAAIVSDNDGSAFITKAEFDSLKNNFQTQIDQYNTSIDSKIDGAIASYLAGIKLSNEYEQSFLLSNKFKKVRFKYKDIIESGEVPFNGKLNLGYGRRGVPSSFNYTPSGYGTSHFSNKDKKVSGTGQNMAITARLTTDNKILNLRSTSGSFMNGSMSAAGASGGNNGFRPIDSFIQLPTWVTTWESTALSGYTGFWWKDKGFTNHDLKCGRVITLPSEGADQNRWTLYSDQLKWIGRGTNVPAGVKQDILFSDMTLSYNGATYNPTTYGMYSGLVASYGHFPASGKNGYTANIGPNSLNISFEQDFVVEGDNELIAGNNKYLPSELIFVGETTPLIPRCKYTSTNNPWSNTLNFSAEGYMMHCDSVTASGSKYTLTGTTATDFGSGVGDFDTQWEKLLALTFPIYHKSNGTQTGVGNASGANYLVIDDYFMKQPDGTSDSPGKYCFFDAESFSVSNDTAFVNNCNNFSIYNGFPLFKSNRTGICTIDLPIQRELNGGISAPTLRLYVTNGPIRDTDDLSLTTTPSGGKTIATNKYTLKGCNDDKSITVTNDGNITVSFECKTDDYIYLHIIPQWTSGSASETEGRENCEVLLDTSGISAVVIDDN